MTNINPAKGNKPCYPSEIYARDKYSTGLDFEATILLSHIRAQASLIEIAMELEGSSIPKEFRECVYAASNAIRLMTEQGDIVMEYLNDEFNELKAKKV